MRVLKDFELHPVAGGDAWYLENPDGSSPANADYNNYYSTQPSAFATITSASDGMMCLAKTTEAGVAGAAAGAKLALYLGQPEAAPPAAVVGGVIAAGYTLLTAPPCKTQSYVYFYNYN